MKSLYQNKTFGGILLVAGTSIGAGMLALPITTGVGGFYPAIVLFLVAFSYMLVTLFLLLEANLYEPSMEANIISMARRRLIIAFRCRVMPRRWPLRRIRTSSSLAP